MRKTVSRSSTPTSVDSFRESSVKSPISEPEQNAPSPPQHPYITLPVVKKEKAPDVSSPESNGSPTVEKEVHSTSTEVHTKGQATHHAVHLLYRRNGQDDEKPKHDRRSSASRYSLYSLPGPVNDEYVYNDPRTPEAVFRRRSGTMRPTRVESPERPSTRDRAREYDLARQRREREEGRPSPSPSSRRSMSPPRRPSPERIASEIERMDILRPMSSASSARQRAWQYHNDQRHAKGDTRYSSPLRHISPPRSGSEHADRISRQTEFPAGRATKTRARRETKPLEQKMEEGTAIRVRHSARDRALAYAGKIEEKKQQYLNRHPEKRRVPSRVSTKGVQKTEGNHDPTPYSRRTPA